MQDEYANTDLDWSLKRPVRRGAYFCGGLLGSYHSPRSQETRIDSSCGLRRLAVGSGLAFQFPTATDDLLGSGKWQVAPTVIPVWMLRRPQGLFFTKVQNYVSVAGDDDRRDINYLTVAPTWIRLLPER